MTPMKCTVPTKGNFQSFSSHVKFQSWTIVLSVVSKTNSLQPIDSLVNEIEAQVPFVVAFDDNVLKRLHAVATNSSFPSISPGYALCVQFTSSVYLALESSHSGIKHLHYPLFVLYL